MKKLNTKERNTRKKTSPKYITNAKGKKVSVILPIKEYESLLEDLEDLILYNKAKDKDNHERIPVLDAFKIIEEKRNGIQSNIN